MLESIRTKIFADGADLAQILELASDEPIKGYTTTPSLMWKAGLTDYAEFAESLFDCITDKPISFEVVADDVDDIGLQAHAITTWEAMSNVKVQITTSTGESLAPLVRELSEAGVKVNVTALMTPSQVDVIAHALKDGAPSCVSVFAGRIADSGVEPLPIMSRSLEILESVAPAAELIRRATRGLEPRSGGLDRLPHHHDDERPDREARPARQRSGCVLTRDRADVPVGRAVCRPPALRAACGKLSSPKAQGSSAALWPTV